MEKKDTDQNVSGVISLYHRKPKWTKNEHYNIRTQGQSPRSAATCFRRPLSIVTIVIGTGVIVETIYADNLFLHFVFFDRFHRLYTVYTDFSQNILRISTNHFGTPNPTEQPRT